MGRYGLLGQCPEPWALSPAVAGAPGRVQDHDKVPAVLARALPRRCSQDSLSSAVGREGLLFGLVCVSLLRFEMEELRSNLFKGKREVGLSVPDVETIVIPQTRELVSRRLHPAALQQPPSPGGGEAGYLSEAECVSQVSEEHLSRGHCHFCFPLRIKLFCNVGG